MVLTNNTVLARNEDILANQVGGDTVMMSVKKGKYYGSNKTGAYIWQLLEKPTTFGELCTKLAADFNIDEEKCVNDVRGFIEQMAGEELIAIR